MRRFRWYAFHPASLLQQIERRNKDIEACAELAVRKREYMACLKPSSDGLYIDESHCNHRSKSFHHHNVVIAMVNDEIIDLNQKINRLGIKIERLMRTTLRA